MLSDVPVGLFLSGGIDSSALAILMAEVCDTPIRTFSVTFDEEEFSEVNEASIIARQIASEHTEIRLRESELVQELPGAVASLDQPSADGFNTFIISRYVRQHGIKAAISGLGGDEIFAGYPTFRRAKRMATVASIPRFFRRAVAETGRAMLSSTSRRQKLWDLMGSDASPDSAYRITRQVFRRPEATALLGSSGLPVRQEQSKSHSSEDVVNWIALQELRGYMANTLLRDTDCMSMAHSLEVRVPFVDPVVVSYVQQLPGAWKLDSKRPKPLLLDTMGQSIPRQIWKRKKMGFTLPFQKWLSSELHGEVEKTFTTTPLIRQVGLDPHAVLSNWRAFEIDPIGQHWVRPWSLYVLLRWCCLNGLSV